MSEFKLKAAGLEASASPEEIKTAVLLGAASQKSASDEDEPRQEADTNEIANAVSAFAKGTRVSPKPLRIIWVKQQLLRTQSP